MSIAGVGVSWGIGMVYVCIVLCCGKSKNDWCQLLSGCYGKDCSGSAVLCKIQSTLIYFDSTYTIKECLSTCQSILNTESPTGKVLPTIIMTGKYLVHSYSKCPASFPILPIITNLIVPVPFCF